MSTTTDPSWPLNLVAPIWRKVAVVVLAALTIVICLWAGQWPAVARFALLVVWILTAAETLNRLSELTPVWLALPSAVALGGGAVGMYGVVTEWPSGAVILAMNALIMGAVAFVFRVVRWAVSWRPARRGA